MSERTKKALKYGLATLALLTLAAAAFVAVMVIGFLLGGETGVNVALVLFAFTAIAGAVSVSVYIMEGG